jgi:hypothetical protein
MRRGRIIAAAVVLAVVLVTAAAGVAATPQQLFSKNAVTQGYGGVGNATPPVQNHKPVTHQVAGANKTVQGPVTNVAPASTGALPFTGLQLGVFALIGVALIGGGLLVRRLGGNRADG